MERSRTVELLSPAGNPEKLQAAVLYGADAVYLAGDSFGMRAAAGNFSRPQLQDAVALCKPKGVAVHVTCNTVPRSDELAALPDYLSFLDGLGVDALIIADLGVFRLAQQYAPHLKLHISTQAGVASYADADAWFQLGASRVILARELSLQELATLRQKTDPRLELEAFVHGSMCVSYSGRCLLSSYMTGRDANRGACAQPCRYRYALVEEKRPGAYYPIEEEGGETFLLNSRDMCMIAHIPELLAVGLDSLKIEGRGKSAYYAASVTAAYRHAIDAALGGDPLPPQWLEETEKTSHRPYSTGFFFGQPGQHTQDAGYETSRLVLAVVETCDVDGSALLSLRNKFSVGDAVELLSPEGLPQSFVAAGLADEAGIPLETVRNLQVPFRLKLPSYAPKGSILRM
ncbi:MAG: U32 family peptidase [Oscillospiraceae bacterium]